VFRAGCFAFATPPSGHQQRRGQPPFRYWREDAAHLPFAAGNAGTLVCGRVPGEKKYRKIRGYRGLWGLKAILDASLPATRQAAAQK